MLSTESFRLRDGGGARDRDDPASPTRATPQASARRERYAVARGGRKRERNAFTLIELLATVAIIGILAGLLGTSIHRSRQTSKTIACLSNLRQISIALQAYVNENEGRMPTLQNRDSVTNGVAAMDTILLPKENRSRVFQCPADRSDLFEKTGTSYFWNFTVNGQDVMNLFSIVGGRDPTRIPLISDKEGFHPELKDKVNVLYADGCVAKELKFSTSLP